MRRKGLGHIEVIIAFVLFIGFILFGLYFFNPLNPTRLIDSSVTYAQKAIVDNTSIPILTYTVVLNDSVSNVVILPLSREDIRGSGVSIENEQGTAVAANYDGGQVTFDRGGFYLFYVRLGDFTSPRTTIPGGSMLVPGVNFTVSSSDRTSLVSEEHFSLLNASYYSDYNRLKTRFNLPGRVDFATSLAFSPEEHIDLLQPIPTGIDVSSKQERREAIRSNGKRVFADFTVRVW